MQNGREKFKEKQDDISMNVIDEDGWILDREVILIIIPKEDSEAVKDVKPPGPQRPLPYFVP